MHPISAAHDLPITNAHPQSTAEPTVFEQSWWLYALCREHLFTDHTDQIARALRPVLLPRPLPDGLPDSLPDSQPDPFRHPLPDSPTARPGSLSFPRQPHILEVGCGPGFYARRLAAMFPHAEVTGIDTCEQLLSRARTLADQRDLTNCRFLRADALSPADFPAEVDAIVTSRLFLILSRRDLALNAMFRSLRPGGVCFVAEPTSRVRSQVALAAMRALSAIGGGCAPGPTRCEVLSDRQFQDFIGTQPWRHVRLWQDRRYQYALCEKSA